MYKSYINLIFAVIVVSLFFISGCKKQTVYNGRPLTISVFNGLDNGYLVYSNYSNSRPTSFRASQQIPNGSALNVNLEIPDISAKFYISPDTLEKDQPVFDEQLNAENGKSYSFYLLGDKPATDHLFFENKFQQYTAGDSITYMQVVNISNDQPISVNIKDEPYGSLVNSLPYKGATEFIKLSADVNHPSYEFEFRDALTGDSLFTETVFVAPSAFEQNRYLYKNWTMVFSGKRGASDINAIKVRKTFYQIN